MSFADIDVWVFDLDNTLYPASCRLFDQIDRRMGAYIANLLDCDPVEARRVQKSYFRQYGTTMRGLMTEHGVEPSAFLSFVHDIDYGPVAAAPNLDRALDRLPGRKIIFTNASNAHADRVLARLGIAHHFEGAFDIHAAGYRPKPDPSAYDDMLSNHRVNPATAAMVEDIPANLAPAHDRGMTTVWVRSDTDYANIGDPSADYVHHVTDDLATWLDCVAESLQ